MMRRGYTQLRRFNTAAQVDEAVARVGLNLQAVQGKDTENTKLAPSNKQEEKEQEKNN